MSCAKESNNWILMGFRGLDEIFYPAFFHYEKIYKYILPENKQKILG